MNVYVGNKSNKFIKIPETQGDASHFPNDLHLHRQALCLCEVLVSEGSRRTGWDTGLRVEVESRVPSRGMFQIVC